MHVFGVTQTCGGLYCCILYSMHILNDIQALHGQIVYSSNSSESDLNIMVNQYNRVNQNNLCIIMIIWLVLSLTF